MRPTENAPSVLPPLKKRGLCNCFYEDFIEVQGCTNPVPFGFVADTQLISARIPKASEKKKTPQKLQQDVFKVKEIF